MTTTKSPIPLELAKTAFLPIDLKKGIVNSGQLFPYDATTILSNNQLIAEQLKHTPAWNILVNVDITSFQYLSAKNDRAQAGAFYTPPKEFTDLLLEPTTKGTQNTLTITKHNPSAFFGTSLDAQLRRRKIDTLILSGVATSNGVYATALDAFQHGYHVIVIEDGCSDRDLELHTLFFEKMFPKTARVRTTKEILQAIEEAR
ncbi:isochorismatase family protein [uncultured Enterococcus sp.]|uniref:isochorismatase family protein n=1 Tax=uncultured Enterococcus sp. TaxID=167972 RepID=UPI002591D946|nr:isochorismatase family protein [uncultured Enterococcus sp.]